MNPDLTLFPGRSAISREIWEARSASCAHRILAGAGAASVVAYREEPTLTLTAVAHGLASDGNFVIATIEDIPEMGEDSAMDVRVSIDKKAPDPSVEVMASSVHFLGQAQWLTSAQRIEAVASGCLPERVAEVAAVRGGNLAIVHTDRVLLHDCGGATPLPYRHLVDGQEKIGRYASFTDDLFTTPEGEFFALETLNSYGACAPTHLFDSLVVGLVPGAILAKQPVRLSCEHVETAVLCIDVDRTGLTLMHVDREGASTAFLSFGRMAHTVEELAMELEHLFDMGLKGCC